MDRLTTRIVPPSGPLDAKLLLIGEAPGREEDQVGKPFVGAAGQLLDRILAQVGIVRSDCLVYNIFCQRPPENKIDYFFKRLNIPRKIFEPTWEGEEHLAQFTEWLQTVHPNLIVALGSPAMHVLTGKHRIAKWRGSIVPCTLKPNTKVYIAHHPSYVNHLMQDGMYEKKAYQSALERQQIQNALPTFINDMARVAEEQEFPEIRRLARDMQVNLSHGEIILRLQRLNKHSLTTAVDIETLPGKFGPMVWCIGFAETPTEGFSIPIIKNGKLAWDAAREAQIWIEISRYFLNPNCQKIFQNGDYDLSILGRYYGLRVAHNTYEDTMWLHHSVHPTLSKGLDYLASMYTKEPYYKDEGKQHHMGRNDEGERTYNARDCCVTHEVFPTLARKARNGFFWDGYKRSMGVFPSLLGMMTKGVRIDLEKKERLAVDFASKAEYHLAELNRLAGYEINLNSPKQKQQFLYVYLGLPVQYNHKTKKPTTDKDAINRLKRFCDERSKAEESEILSHILSYQEFSKLLSTYANMEIEADGRVRTSYSFISTWRLGSKESHFGGGGNLQNIPVRTESGRKVRELFVPDRGRVMGASDLSQAEARVVAFLAHDSRAIDIFADPTQDIHWDRTRLIFDIPDNIDYGKKESFFRDKYTREEHSHYNLRRVGKSVVHASNYGMRAFMLQTILAREGFIFPLHVCEALLAAYQRNNPLILQWQGEVRNKIRSDRTLVTPLGRRRVFSGRITSATEREAYAFVPQSTVGEILEISIQSIADRLTPTVMPLLNVHDEVVFDCPPENFIQALWDVKECMETTLEIDGRELTIPCDFKGGPNWAHLKEFDSPDDVKEEEVWDWVAA